MLCSQVIRLSEGVLYCKITAKKKYERGKAKSRKCKASVIENIIASRFMPPMPIIRSFGLIICTS